MLLQVESKANGSLLKKFNIDIAIGRILNKNKNPTAENANQEFQKEILKLAGKTGPITNTDLVIILKNINSRILYNGYTAK